MVKNIKLHKNALYINDELITFDFDIDTLIVMDDKIIVLLDIPYDSSELDNIYAVNLSGKIIWRIEKVACSSVLWATLSYRPCHRQDHRALYSRQRLVESEKY